MGEKNILLKVHKSYRDVIAICDEVLLGKILVEGKRQLDLSGGFFRGDLLDEEQVLEEIQKHVNEDATFNIVGEDSISVAIKSGLIQESDVMRIEGIPFALYLL